MDATVLLRNGSPHLWSQVQLEVRVDDESGAQLVLDTATQGALAPEGEAALATKTWVHLGEHRPASARCTLRLVRSEHVTAPAHLKI